MGVMKRVEMYRDGEGTPWRINLMVTAGGRMTISLSSPKSKEPIILQPLSEADYRLVIELMKQAVEPTKIMTWTKGVGGNGICCNARRKAV